MFVRGRELSPLVLGSAVVTLGLVYLIATGEFVFGSVEGRWVYPYYTRFDAHGIFTFALVFPCAVLLTWRTVREVERHEGLVVLAWLVAGFVLQIVLRWPTPASLDAIIRSDVANSFYSPTLRFTLSELLRDFRSIAPTLPQHAGSNMAGKVAFFFALGQFTTVPQTMGYLIIAISNLGGILVYLVAKELFDDRRVALFALILFLFVPCKLFFFPLLNVVTPVWILLAFYAQLRFLRSDHSAWGALLGVVLYGIVFFEPLPLSMAPVFLVFLLRARRLRRGEIASIGRLVLVSVGAFAAVHAAMLLTFGYDLFDNLLGVLDEASTFNDRTNRRYGVWVTQNLIQFLVNAGIGQSMLLFGVIAHGVGRWAGRGSEGSTDRSRRAWILGVSLLGILGVLDVLGIIRGEGVRLWIFLACFLPLVTAELCARSQGLLMFSTVLGCTLLQAAITVSMVGFVMP